MNDNNLFLSPNALPPSKIAERAEEVGISKVNLDFWTLVILSILAGAFIAMGAVSQQR